MVAKNIKILFIVTTMRYDLSNKKKPLSVLTLCYQKKCQTHLKKFFMQNKKKSFKHFGKKFLILMVFGLYTHDLCKKPQLCHSRLKSYVGQQ